MQFVGSGRPLGNSDVSVIAGYLGCEIAALRAVLAVEAAGKGFGPDKRPIILNEPHVFYRELPSSKRAAAVNAGLAYQRWGSRPYPKTQALRYVWLDRAMQIDESAALKSCSWGLGQIMGFNYKLCGFSTVREFVEAMKASEGAQLYAVARFIVSRGLQKALQSKNWVAFAKGYNGAGYAKNAYHLKLANAYVKRPASEKIVPPPATAAELKALRGTESVPEPAPEPPTNPKPPSITEPIASGGVVGGITGIATKAVGFDWIEAIVFAVILGIIAFIIYKVVRD